MINPPIKETILLLGSNLGNVLQNLNSAKQGIAESIGLISKESSIYRTAPWGVTNQPEFLNQVVAVMTSLYPSDLLAATRLIEQNMGRKRKGKWEARVIDLDILFYQEEVINEKNLILPHPGIPHRRFTLEPLAEIAPDFVHPVLKKKISELLSECDDPSPVTRTDL